MDFIEWLNNLYGYSEGAGIDICDISEEETAELYLQYEEEIKNDKH